MLIPSLTFVLVLGIVLGMYWVFIARPEQATDAALRRRLTGTRPVMRVAAGLQREAQRLSSISTFNRLLAARAGFVAPVQRLVEQSGVKVTVGVVVLSAACLGVLGVLIGEWWTNTLWAGVALGACLVPLPFLYLSWKRSRRIQRFEELFPEALDLMSRAMRSGHTFITSIGMVAEELPEPIAAEFKLLHDQQNFGMPMDEALRNFGERVPLLACEVLRDGDPDAARIRRESHGGARQSRVGHPRPVHGHAAGPDQERPRKNDGPCAGRIASVTCGRDKHPEPDALRQHDG